MNWAKQSKVHDVRLYGEYFNIVHTLLSWSCALLRSYIPGWYKKRNGEKIWNADQSWTVRFSRLILSWSFMLCPSPTTPKRKNCPWPRYSLCIFDKSEEKQCKEWLLFNGILLNKRHWSWSTAIFIAWGAFAVLKQRILNSFMPQCLTALGKFKQTL